MTTNTYYIKNKDKIKEQSKIYRSEKVLCECGSTYTKEHKQRHFRTKKHIAYMKEKESDEITRLKEQNEEKQKQNERLIEQNERFMENEKQFRKDIAKLRVIEKKYNKFLKHARQWQ